MFNKVDGKKMAEDMVASALWLKSRADCTGKVSATGFCYGGGIANTLAARLGGDSRSSRRARYASRRDKAGLRWGL
jgi:carboxymethylenebutenolidase